MTQPTAVERLNRALEDNDLGWESRSTIDFLGAGSIECHQSVDVSNYEIEFHIWDDVAGDGPCRQGAIACGHFEPPATPHPCHADAPPCEEERDFSKSFVDLPAQEASTGGDLWKAMVDHEVGHTVGLADPTATPSGLIDPYGRTCTVSFDVNGDGTAETYSAVPSLMHANYCANIPPAGEIIWPTIFDLAFFDAWVK